MYAFMFLFLLHFSEKLLPVLASKMTSWPVLEPVITKLKTKVITQKKTLLDQKKKLQDKSHRYYLHVLPGDFKLHFLFKKNGACYDVEAVGGGGFRVWELGFRV